jgi:signal peptidase I
MGRVDSLNNTEFGPSADSVADEAAGGSENYELSVSGPYASEAAARPAAPSQARRAGRLARELAETIVPAIIIALLIHVFLAQATRVFGQSMEPNLHTNMRLVVEKVSYRMHSPDRGDIVVLRVRPGDELLIKRIIGLPGDEVAIHDGQVYVNGNALDEPYLNQNTRGNLAPRVVPPLHVFVMGDNRRASNDSRSFGPVHIDNIVGRAWFSYWPMGNIGPLG